ncbi:Fluconazole resistance protein 1 [Apiospora arundinis]
MARNSQQWDLGEPEVGDRDQPVIHDIATKLGCIRSNAGADMPPYSICLEEEAGLANLAGEWKSQQKIKESQAPAKIKSEIGKTRNRDNQTISELDPSDLEENYRKVLMNGSHGVQTLPPESLAFYDAFNPNTASTDFEPSAALFGRTTCCLWKWRRR